MKRHREYRQVPGGGSGSYWECRVVELADAKKPAPPSEPVPDDTPEHDWRAADGPPPEGVA